MDIFWGYVMLIVDDNGCLVCGCIHVAMALA